MDTEAFNDYPIYLAEVIDEYDLLRHDSRKLARTIIDLWEERTGPLVE
jgi:hypothetical protein